jgi:hypothetical protein
MPSHANKVHKSRWAPLNLGFFVWRANPSCIIFQNQKRIFVNLFFES